MARGARGDPHRDRCGVSGGVRRAPGDQRPPRAATLLVACARSRMRTIAAAIVLAGLSTTGPATKTPNSATPNSQHALGVVDLGVGSWTKPVLVTRDAYLMGTRA